MGCASSKPSSCPKENPIYSVEASQLKNSLKKPGSAKKNANVRFADEEVSVAKRKKEDSPNEKVKSINDSQMDESKKEVEIGTEMRKQSSNTEQERSITNGKVDKTANKQAELDLEHNEIDLKISSESIEADEKEVASESPPCTHPTKLEEDTNVMSLESLPVMSAKSQELLFAKEKLVTSETEIHKRDEQIQKLLAENERLKKDAIKSKEAQETKPIGTRSLSDAQKQWLEKKPLTMRDKLNQIKMKSKRSIGSEHMPYTSQSSSGALDVPTAVTHKSKSSDVVDDSANVKKEVSDEPFSFKVSVDQARKRRETNPEQKPKAAETEWEMSELMVL